MVLMSEDFEAKIKDAVDRKPEFALSRPGMSVSPPVFVKVDRYKELLQDIQKLRSYSLGLRDALDAMSEIEKEFKSAMELTNKVLDKVNIIISSLDMKLLKKTGASHGDDDSAVKPPAEVETYLKGIYDQVEKLKSELQTLS
jgi:Mg2+ and Co2+ transporter CorA